ncbi:MipA/OmpV family protein [Aquisediminimonas profunda]|uniref:MipA/OmpV family protein n=1 Tax=Aquisediminimonas profunda TaxID=1550733 RepID=UPI001C62D657|nr:MipA/OmpV family protein [Aquisediminimonas profunda]
MRFLGLTLVGALCASPALADDRPRPRDYVTVAVGAGTIPSYTGSDENIFIPALLVRGRINGFAFVTRGVNLSVDLMRGHAGDDLDIKLGPLLNLRNERSSRIKDPQVAALGTLPRTLEGGLYAGISKTGVLTSEHDQIGVRVSYLHDMLGKHGSHVMTTSFEYGTPLSRTTFVGAQATVTFVGKGFGRTYFDIDPAGSTASGLAAYSAAGSKSGASKMAFTLAGAKSLSGDLRKGWAIVIAGQYGRVMGRYARSPIVADAGDANQWLGGLGLAYTF